MISIKCQCFIDLAPLCAFRLFLSRSERNNPMMCRVRSSFLRRYFFSLLLCDSTILLNKGDHKALYTFSTNLVKWIILYSLSVPAGTAADSMRSHLSISFVGSVHRWFCFMQTLQWLKD